MVEFINIIFSSFMTFLGFLILFSAIFTVIYAFYNRTLRFFTILKHGYPPEHCNVDGDHVYEEEDEEE